MQVLQKLQGRFIAIDWLSVTLI